MSGDALEPGEGLEPDSGDAIEPKSGNATEPESGDAIEPKSGDALEPKSGEPLEPQSGDALEPKSGEAVERYESAPSQAMEPPALPPAVIENGDRAFGPHLPTVRDSWMWEFLLQDQTTPYAALTLLSQGRFRALASDPPLNRLHLLRHLQHQLEMGTLNLETLAALGGLQNLATQMEGTPPWRPIVPSAELYGRVKIELVIQHLRRESLNWAAFEESLRVLFPESIPDTEEERWYGLQRAQQEMWALAAEPTPLEQEKLIRRYPRAHLVAALRAFLGAAWGVVGSPYLQLVADDIRDGRWQLDEGGRKEEVVPPTAVVTMKELLAAFPARGREVAAINGPGTQRKKRRLTAATPRQAPATPQEAMPDLPSPGGADAPPSDHPDLAAVVGDLRVTSQALHQMGHDPLPAALAQAGGARSTRNTTRAAAAAVENSGASSEGGRQAAAPEEGEGGGVEVTPETMAQRAAARGKEKVSMMDRQEGARTLEWTEEEDPIENTPEAGERPPRLPSSGAREPAPAKIRKSEEGGGGSVGKSGKPRRETNPWRPVEEEALITGVKEFGEGHWKRILTEYADVFVRRTGVDLKDKWRTRSKDHDFK